MSKYKLYLNKSTDERIICGTIVNIYMKTFKEYLIIEMSKKKHKTKNKPIELSLAKGSEFAMVGKGKSGLMQADRKEFKRKKERKEGKQIAQHAIRGDY